MNQQLVTNNLNEELNKNTNKIKSYNFIENPDLKIELPRPKNGKNIVVTRKKETFRDSIYIIQPDNGIFDPNNISGTPPNSFMNDLKKRMDSYYVANNTLLSSK
jgi:hypothetical protein